MAVASTSKKTKIDPMNGMFSLRTTPCNIQNFHYSNILEYCDLLDSIHNVNNNYRHAMKKGEDLFTSMFVTAIHFAETRESDKTADEELSQHFHFKCKVKAEMKKRESYIVQCSISTDNKVLSCECQCAGGAKPACCKHAFGLLYAILNYSKNEMYSAPTDKLQTWHRPRTFVVSPKKANISFPSSSSKSCDTCSTNLPPTTVNYDALAGLQSVTPFFSVSWKDNYKDIDSIISYNKSMALPMFKDPLHTVDNFPFLCESDRLFFQNNVNLSLDKAHKIERDTTSQSSANLWFEERSKRITASTIFKIVEVMKKPSCDSEMKALADKFLSPDDISSLKPVAHGKLLEPSIQNMIRHTYKDSVFRNTGLCIHPVYPFIAASPDGFVFDKDVKMIVEVKTVFNVKKCSLNDLLKTRKHFCILEEDGQLKINKHHSYYFQMQCQMFCSNVHTCLFALFYSFDKPLYTEYVHFDKEFWDGIFPCLQAFYFQYYLPKLALKVKPV